MYIYIHMYICVCVMVRVYNNIYIVYIYIIYTYTNYEVVTPLLFVTRMRANVGDAHSIAWWYCGLYPLVI